MDYAKLKVKQIIYFNVNESDVVRAYSIKVTVEQVHNDFSLASDNDGTCYYIDSDTSDLFSLEPKYELRKE